MNVMVKLWVNVVKLHGGLLSDRGREMRYLDSRSVMMKGKS